MWKRALLYGGLGLAALACAGFGYLSLRSPNYLPAETVQVRMTPETIKRGEYIFTVMADCDGCHSERDLSKFSLPVVPRGRGKGWQFPSELGLPGQVVAGNITPDVETGIGAWTDGDKIRAIREGVSRNGRPLFPMMPYQAYAKMSDTDVQALVAYMNTLPAIRNPLPETKLNFPVNYLIAGSPAPSRNVANADRNSKLEWGKYLVTMGGCAGCHTPEEKGERLPGKLLAGGAAFTVGKYKVVSANITPDPDTGIGKMGEAEFVERFHQYRKYLQDGPPATTAENFTLMPWLSFAQIPAEDLSAIYAYLRTVPPVNNPAETHPTK
ncbi:MAG: c-type cytochrome [Acidobacteria bacterium]|nr:c-type cytochrome [Acidobacteriota bacterium]